VVPALAQFGQMQGTVKNEEGQPAANIVVSVDRQDIRGHYEVKTDRNGRFFHAGLPLGTYSVSVKQKNGQPFALNGIVVRLAAPANVDIDLQQEFMRAQAAAQGIQVQGEGQLSNEQMQAIQQAAKEREEAIAKRQELTGKFQSGLEAMKAKNYDQAIADFEAAAVVDPTQHVIYAQMGEAYKEKAVAARGDERRQFYEKSMESYQKALAMKADDASYHNNFALALANAGKVEEAQAELVKAAELDPMNAARYYFNLGAVLVNRGDSNAAAEAFLKATQADPNMADGFFQLGIALMGKATMDPSGKMVPAAGTVEAFQKYLALAPTGPNAQAAKDALTALGGTVPTNVRR
jgi:tetratricopeptide (TPR) repeat protein